MDTKNQKLKNIFEQDNVSFPKSLPNSNTHVLQLFSCKKLKWQKSNNFEEKNLNKIFGFQHKAIKFHT